ncbi:bile acid-sensitive ion channel-like [Convolutriloba macropyga]|uniref:bile acid-sensitive ion channel-like n=1 Tax=Convolutriloba macropyga TaxID=536237 RepID=UPI003F51BD10
MTKPGKFYKLGPNICPFPYFGIGKRDHPEVTVYRKGDSMNKTSSLEDILANSAGKPIKEIEFKTNITGLYGSTLDSHILHCQWKGKNCIDNWRKFSHCLSFDHGDTVLQAPDESLRLILTLNASDSAPFAENSLSFIVGTTDSFQKWDLKANVQLMPGKTYDLGLKSVTIDERSGTTDCIPTGQLGHFKHLPNLGGYQHFSCVYECLEVSADRACNCTRGDSAFFDPQVGLACSPIDLLLCSHAIYVAAESCYQSCRPQCTYNFNEKILSMAKFPSRSAYKSGSLQVNRSKYSYEYLRQNGVELNIHFSTLTHTTIVTTLKYSFIDTISAFGGLGALMAGASLVTIVELSFFILDMINLLLIETCFFIE